MRDAEPIAIELQDVVKTYRLHRRPVDRVMEQLGLSRLVTGSQSVDFDALRGVSLRVKRGERLGIVGRNGAGKTTLLKLITGNFAPTRGSVSVRGNVQALMQVGLGFHAGFTGNENARSALLYNGLDGRALEDALADVIDFCELGDFLHQPLATYSLGMRMRLQFATATAIQPDILVIDEIMGAGDAYFSAKSADRMKRLTNRNCTLLLVSHSPYQVMEFCDQAVWLDGGSLRMAGNAHDVLGAYEVFIERLGWNEEQSGGGISDKRAQVATAQVRLADGREVYRLPGLTGVKFDSIQITDGIRPISEVRYGSNAVVEFSIVVEKDGEYACFYLLTLWSDSMRLVARIEAPVDRFTGKAGEVRKLSVDLGPFAMCRGRYYLSASIYDRSTGEASGAETRYDVLARCMTLEVEGESMLPFYVHPATWSFS